MFDFSIKYRTRKSSKAPDALNQCPLNPDSSSDSNIASDEVDVVSYSSVCKMVNLYLDNTKVEATWDQRYNLLVVKCSH